VPRANRFHVPGLVWHITHRCHNRHFLLKFQRDRRRWRYWLFQARKRYGLSILNFIVTSNHIHLLVRDTEPGCIARSMQLIASRVAQEYNQRKGRRGAFWEDRYFATAVESDRHLVRCLVYIDMNMVRAGAVNHPSEWPVSGYNEIQTIPPRYRVIDLDSLCELTGSASIVALQSSHQQWLEHSLSAGNLGREPHWTESVAIGSEAFIEGLKARLGMTAYHRRVMRHSDSSFIIQE
jgi:putative transposase